MWGPIYKIKKKKERRLIMSIKKAKEKELEKIPDSELRKPKIHGGILEKDTSDGVKEERAESKVLENYICPLCGFQIKSCPNCGTEFTKYD